MKLKSISCMEWEFLAELIRKLPKYSWGNQKQLRGNSLNVQTQFIPKRKLPIFSLAALAIVVPSIYIQNEMSSSRSSYPIIVSSEPPQAVLITCAPLRPVASSVVTSSYLPPINPTYLPTLFMEQRQIQNGKWRIGKNRGLKKNIFFLKT